MSLAMFNIISKQWATNEDIEILADCRKSKASSIKQEVRKKIIADGKKLPPNSDVVPMARVVEHLGIDEERVIRMAKLEMEIKKADTAMSTINKIKRSSL